MASKNREPLSDICPPSKQFAPCATASSTCSICLATAAAFISGPRSGSLIYGFAKLYYVEAGNGFLCWTFDQIVSARRANKFDGGTNQAPVANLVRKHFHDRLSKIADAIRSEEPEVARSEVESFLVGMAASSAL